MICIFRVFEKKRLPSQRCPSHCLAEVKSLEIVKKKIIKKKLFLSICQKVAVLREVTALSAPETSVMS